MTDQLFNADLVKLFETGELSDTVVRMGNQELHLHSVILMARSPVFRTMLSGEFREKLSRVVELDSEFRIARIFFKCFYSGVIPVDLSPTDYIDLFRMAKQYIVTPLEESFTQRIMKELSAETCLDVLNVAGEHDHAALLNAAAKVAACELRCTDLLNAALDGEALRAVLDALITGRDELRNEKTELKQMIKKPPGVVAKALRQAEGQMSLHRAAAEG
eukprot:Selendium_serpulae@DN6202_c0_g1_i2.p1